MATIILFVILNVGHLDMGLVEAKYIMHTRNCLRLVYVHTYTHKSVLMNPGSALRSSYYKHKSNPGN